MSLQEVRAAELHRHPQLDADIQAVRTLCPGSSVSVRSDHQVVALMRSITASFTPLLLFFFYNREYVSIDGVDVDLHINANFLDVR